MPTEKKVIVPTQVQKLQEYAGHLLDDMILLREKYSMLKPMLFDTDVNEAWGRNRKRGFFTLQRTLFFSCAQDVVKIATDKDPRAPSLNNIVEKIPVVRDELRELFAVWKLDISDEDDPDVVGALKRFELAEQEDRRKQFDELYTNLFERWGAFLGSPALQGMRTIRNKVSAHTEIRHHVDKYARVDLGTLGRAQK